MPVDDTRKEYQENLYKWRLVRDACQGSQMIKARRKTDTSRATGIESEAGTLYLPAPNAYDNSEENRERYRAYRMRANYVNFTGHTKDALIGMVCRDEPIVEVPPILEPMLENANGAGESLYSLIKRSLSEVLTVARQGILIDYPELPKGLSLAQTQGIMPFLKFYCAESVINWRTDYLNGKTQLVLVVLKEEVYEYQDEYSAECKDRYRVLMLNEDGVYVQRLYNAELELLVDEEGNPDIIPLQANGKPFNEIPFIFIGSTNNDPEPDKSVLYDLAEVNLAHYRNSADYEESCFLVGQPTPVITGVDQGWLSDVLNNRVEIGSRAAIPLPEGGSAMLLQAAPNQMPSEGMLKKETQMVQIGAKIISDGGQAETAEAARIRFAGQNSKLATIVGNIEAGYEQALEYALMFLGGEGDIQININKDFYEKTIDPQLLMAKIQLLDRGVIAATDMRDYLRQSGDIDKERTDIDIENDREEVNPFE